MTEEVCLTSTCRDSLDVVLCSGWVNLGSSHSLGEVLVSLVVRSLGSSQSEQVRHLSVEKGNAAVKAQLLLGVLLVGTHGFGSARSIEVADECVDGCLNIADFCGETVLIAIGLCHTGIFHLIISATIEFCRDFVHACQQSRESSLIGSILGLSLGGLVLQFVVSLLLCSEVFHHLREECDGFGVLVRAISFGFINLFLNLIKGFRNIIVFLVEVVSSLTIGRLVILVAQGECLHTGVGLVEEVLLSLGQLVGVPSRLVVSVVVGESLNCRSEGSLHIHLGDGVEVLLVSLLQSVVESGLHGSDVLLDGSDSILIRCAFEGAVNGHVLISGSALQTRSSGHIAILAFLAHSRCAVEECIVVGQSSSNRVVGSKRSISPCLIVIDIALDGRNESGESVVVLDSSACAIHLVGSGCIGVQFGDGSLNGTFGRGEASLLVVLLVVRNQLLHSGLCVIILLLEILDGSFRSLVGVEFLHCLCHLGLKCRNLLLNGSLVSAVAVAERSSALDGVRLVGSIHIALQGFDVVLNALDVGSVCVGDTLIYALNHIIQTFGQTSHIFAGCCIVGTECSFGRILHSTNLSHILVIDRWHGSHCIGQLLLEGSLSILVGLFCVVGSLVVGIHLVDGAQISVQVGQSRHVGVVVDVAILLRACQEVIEFGSRCVVGILGLSHLGTHVSVGNSVAAARSDGLHGIVDSLLDVVRLRLDVGIRELRSSLLCLIGLLSIDLEVSHLLHDALIEALGQSLSLWGSPIISIGQGLEVGFEVGMTIEGSLISLIVLVGSGDAVAEFINLLADVALHATDVVGASQVGLHEGLGLGVVGQAVEVGHHGGGFQFQSLQVFVVGVHAGLVNLDSQFLLQFLLHGSHVNAADVGQFEVVEDGPVIGDCYGLLDSDFQFAVGNKHIDWLALVESCAEGQTGFFHRIGYIAHCCARAEAFVCICRCFGLAVDGLDGACLVVGIQQGIDHF